MSEPQTQNQPAAETSPEQEQSRKPVYSPTSEVIETASDYVIRCDVPGASQQSVQVTLDDGVLNIHAETNCDHPSNEKLLMGEFQSCVYERAFNLRRGVQVEGITARVKHGVLTLTLPKPEEQQPLSISVQSAE